MHVGIPLTSGPQIRGDPMAGNYTSRSPLQQLVSHSHQSGYPTPLLTSYHLPERGSPRFKKKEKKKKEVHPFYAWPDEQLFIPLSIKCCRYFSPPPRFPFQVARKDQTTLRRIPRKSEGERRRLVGDSASSSHPPLAGEPNHQ